MSRIGNGKGLLIFGIIVAVSCGAVLMVSDYLGTHETEWYNAQTTLLNDEFNAGKIGDSERAERIYQNQMTRDWMEAQQYTVRPIATVGIYVGFLLIFVGLIVFATEGGVDERTKSILLTIAGIMLFVLLLLFTGSLTISIGAP